MCTQVSYVNVAAKVNERVNLWVFFFFFPGRGGGVGDSSNTPIWNEKGLSLSLLSQRKSKKRSSYYRETYVEYSKSVNSGCINQAVGLSKYTIFILSQLSDDILSDGVGKRLRYQGSKRFEKERESFILLSTKICELYFLFIAYVFKPNLPRNGIHYCERKWFDIMKTNLFLSLARA